jgi:alpha/beta superfamily hydrolase
VPGPVGRLEALLERPAEPAGVAVVCHPHPEGGGTMLNKVVHTLARAFARAGYTTLRFNFRGTGASAGSYDGGVGEVDDALAALEFMRQDRPQGPSWIAGFSFGAAIAIRAAVRVPVDGLISVAPAVRRFAAGLAAQPQCPWLIVQGGADELVDVDDTIAWVNGLDPGPELLVLEGVDHFFHGRLNDLRAAAAAFLERPPE